MSIGELLWLTIETYFTFFILDSQSILWLTRVKNLFVSNFTENSIGLKRVKHERMFLWQKLHGLVKQTVIKTLCILKDFPIEIDTISMY